MVVEFSKGWLFVLLVFFLVGCPPKPPTKSYRDAMDALKKARGSLAERCAKNELNSAEKMMARARKLMDQGKYAEAREAFKNAQKLALKAREEAIANKEECLKPRRRPPPRPPTIVGTGETPQEDNRESLKTIYFDFNKYSITSGAGRILRKHADWLNKHPKVKVEVAGHCDQRGSVEYNLALGERRALAVKRYLVTLGVSASQISTISYGHQKPADPRHNTDAYAKNRRAEFRITR
jgi:peptidoglycan-associated lipoprotein